MKRPARLSVRFALAAAIILIVVSAVSAWLAVRADQAALTAQAHQEAGRLADLVAAASAGALAASDPAALDSALQALARDAAIGFLEIRDASARVRRTLGTTAPAEPGRLIFVTRPIQHADGAPLGQVTLGLSAAPVEQAVSGIVRRLLLREVLASLALVGLLAFLTHRVIGRPLQRLGAVLDHAQASGDVRVRVDAWRTDEIGDLSRRLNAFLATAQELRTELAGAARSLAMAAEEVARSAVESMEDMALSSQKVRELIGAIEQVAFETNVLALNVAVEEARAGAQGGAAGVAAEVRSLAERSAGAASEIRSLVASSGQRLEGARLLQQVVASARRVAERMAETAADGPGPAGTPLTAEMERLEALLRRFRVWDAGRVVDLESERRARGRRPSRTPPAPAEPTHSPASAPALVGAGTRGGQP